MVALLYAGGILAARMAPASPFVLLGVSLALVPVALAWGRARPGLLCLLAFLAGAANLKLHTAVISPHDLRRVFGDRAALARVRGTLSETPSLRVYEQGERASWRTMARVAVRAVSTNGESWQPAAGRLAVTTAGTLTNLFAGQVVEVRGVMALPRVAAAEGTFDYRAFLQEQGIYYQLQADSADDWRILASPPAPPLADRFRGWARRALARGLPGEDESLRLEWALTLGWKTALTEEVSEPFVRAATYHIFAVDGLRMAIVFGIFFGLFRALGLPRPLSGLVLVPLIWFYVALTGWPASAIRATVMLTVVIVGWVLKRPGELLNSLFAAALIILTWEPQQIFQAGFQLSFLVVLCIIVLLPPLWGWVERLTAPDPLLPAELRPRWRRVWRGPARYVGDLLLVSFAAWVGALPLVAYYFHILTPVSTPANLVAVPLCGLVLVSDLASLSLAGWLPAAAELFNHAGWFLMECIRVSSHWFAGWPGAYYYVAAPGLFTSALYYAILLAVATGWLFRPRVRAWATPALGLAAGCWCWQTWQAAWVTRLTILPARGGQAIYFDAPGARNDLLIDCGATNAVQYLTKPFLRAQGVNRLPGLLLTHGDSRHIGGAETLATLFPAGKVWTSPVRFRSPAYRHAVREFSGTPGRLQSLSRGDHLGPWTIVHPEANDRFPQADDNALVLMGALQGTRVLLLSDLGRPGQNALLERKADVRADIVVTGLPTASEALGEDLLQAVQPRVIIVADSEFPAAGRASPKLQERLAQGKVPVIYTRWAGTTTLELRRGRWELRTMGGLRLTSQKPALETDAAPER